MITFLGGTCNNSTWREALIPELEELNIAYFNPVVLDWNSEAQAKEEAIKNDPATIQLYVITSEMTGVFSIAEVVDASNKYPARTVFSFLEDGFDEGQVKSLKAMGKLIRANGAHWVHIEEVPDTLLKIESNFPV